MSQPFAALDLRGMTALIVGATSPAGFIVAKSLGLAGARLMLGGPDASALEHAMQDLQDLGIDTRWVASDFSSEEQRIHLVKSTLERMGDIDVLVTSLPDTEFARSVAENVAALSMLTQGWGRIVHLGGAVSKISDGGVSLDVVVKEQAKAWRSGGLRVNAVFYPEAGLDARAPLFALEAAALLFAGPSGLGFTGQCMVIEGAMQITSGD